MLSKACVKKKKRPITRIQLYIMTTWLDWGILNCVIKNNCRKFWSCVEIEGHSDE